MYIVAAIVAIAITAVSIFQNKSWLYLWWGGEKMDDYLLTTSQVAKRLGINTNRVYDLYNAGLLMYLKLGSKKVSNETLNAFIRKYQGTDIDYMLENGDTGKEANP